MLVPDVRYLPKVINGVLVVAAPAEIDVTNSGQLRTTLLRAATSGSATVVVDLTPTAFCDASGIHVLVRAAAGGGGLCLAIPADGAVPRIIGLTRLDHLIPCFPSVAQAVAGAPAVTLADVPHQRRQPQPGGGRVVTAR
jgi:anti-anti-sigma factor